MAKEGSLDILHVEDNPAHAELVRRALRKSGMGCDVHLVMSFEEYNRALQKQAPDVVLCDNHGLDFEGTEALKLLQKLHPHVPFLFVCGSFDAGTASALKTAGAADCVLKSDLSTLARAIRRALSRDEPLAAPEYVAGMEHLVTVVQELSLVRDLAGVIAIVRHAARELTGADGATFVLRDGDMCHYVDEEAIAPLWKGQRFPMSACVSGWAMLNREAAVIEDIYSDDRIPHEAYRPTFVKSLVMVPIRTLDPVGAIGNYWARRHQPSDEEVKLLRALADTTAVALENVRAYEGLEQRVRERTAELEAVNHELEAFSYSVSHDLRGPLRSISGFTQLVYDDYHDKLDDNGKRFLEYIRGGTQHMSELIEALLDLAQVTRTPLKRGPVDLSALAGTIVQNLRQREPQRNGAVKIEDGLTAEGDARLLQALLTNLLGNAWKFTRKTADARIEVGRWSGDDEEAFFVRDNGAGFDAQRAHKLFTPFQRQHAQEEFEGTGIGLATVQRIVHRHGGRVWAESQPGEGAAFFFTLG